MFTKVTEDEFNKNAFGASFQGHVEWIVEEADLIKMFGEPVRSTGKVTRAWYLKWEDAGLAQYFRIYDWKGERWHIGAENRAIAEFVNGAIDYFFVEGRLE